MKILRVIWSWIWLAILRRRYRSLRDCDAGDENASALPLYVFGDSLSDPGNVHRMVRWLRGPSPTPTPHYYGGRFCDGPNWVDLLSGQLHYRAASAWDGGTNYAHGGAQAGFGLSTLVVPALVPNVGEQIRFFTEMGRRIEPSCWTVLLCGHNNLFAMVYGKDDTSCDTVLDRWMGHLEQLYELGGRKFVVPTLTPIQRTPETPKENRETLGQWHTQVNAGLPARLEAFRKRHAEAQVVSPDLGGLVHRMLDHPADYGFTNIDKACYDTKSKRLHGDRAHILLVGRVSSQHAGATAPGRLRR